MSFEVQLGRCPCKFFFSNVSFRFWLLKKPRFSVSMSVTNPALVLTSINEMCGKFDLNCDCYEHFNSNFIEVFQLFQLKFQF